MKKIKLIMAALLLMLVFLLVGCGKKEEAIKKDIDFTVCDKTRMPEELIEIIEEKKGKIFKGGKFGFWKKIGYISACCLFGFSAFSI